MTEEGYMVEYHEKQLQALDLLGIHSDVSTVLYGGAVFGGKSLLGCEWQIMRRLKYPGTKGLIGRAELKKLRLSTMATFWEQCAKRGLVPGVHFSYNGQDHVIKWFNGSQTILMDLADMPSDPEFQRFGSIEITDYFVDEGAEVSKRCIDILNSRVRYKLVNGKAKGLITCNPSKGWLYNEFYLPFKENRLPDHLAFVRALPTDNPYMPDKYYQSLLRLPEYDKQRLLYGNWEFDDDTAKLFFTSDIRAMFRSEPARDKEESYITADIARFGADKSVIMLWKGLRVLQVSTLEKQGVDVVSQFIRDLRDTHGVPLKNIVVDEDGIGGGVVDNLRCTGFINHSKATDNAKYVSIKHECYFKLASYIAGGKINIEGANEALQAVITRELEAIKRHNSDKDTRLCVTPKDVIKQLQGFSPDHADCLMMRMYFELHPNRGKYVIV